MLNPLARKLRAYGPLSDTDVLGLSEAFNPGRQVEARRDIIEEGDDPRAVNVILDGWACRYRQLSDGRRQIVSLLLPGDLCDPHIFLLDRMDHSIGALTPLTLTQIPGATLQELIERSPVLDRALHREALASAAIQREWTVSLGCRSGIERLAHLLCELHTRLSVVGLADATSFPMPLIQSDLADALGQTTVHINRTLRELRALGLISLRSRLLTLHDLAGLTELAHFDPVYMHNNSPENNS